MISKARFASVIVLCFTMILVNSVTTHAASINYLPCENAELGRNSNAYLSIYGTPSIELKEAFVNEIAAYAKAANAKWGVPTSAIMGMAIIESGYGTTRIAIQANNIFGIKAWGYNPPDAWQLKGQPNEDYEAIPVLADYGKDRIIYDESKRRDNWYRKFSSYEEAVNYLSGNLLLNYRYGFALNQYQDRINSGWRNEDASKQYLYEIADAGYNHLGGEYYRNKIARVMEEWNLYQYDEKGFADTVGHWANEEISFITSKGWANGYPDGTFKPGENLTRAQAAKMISNFIGLDPTGENIQFSDVSDSFWGKDFITRVAQHGVMNGIGTGKFSPETYMTRAQMAQMFFNAGFYQQVATTETSGFNDINKSYWAFLAIETMNQEGVMAGYPNGNFGPADPITRAQMAAVMYRIFQKE